ncbi:MAG: ATP-dependent helicase HrpB [Bacteroidales bacterium]|nr:ATP-dependent helicase HrpB [Bacteroidales bacterium]
MTPTTISPEGLALPAAEIARQVNDALAAHPQLVITAPPGAGKSTLLPLTILESLPHGAGGIVMLEPRRLAARQIAERMAQLLGQDVGHTVGYTVRFDSRKGKQTRVEVVTEGILTRRLVADPALEGVSTIIFDEFHERSIFADVALALVREAQQVLRPDLRIVIMSATIDATSICRLLGAPLIESRGRMFPVEVLRADECDAATCPEVVAKVVRKAHQHNEGDILAFLPGEAEIRRAASLLDSTLGTTRVMPLYGMLPQAEQRRTIAPSRPGERKVVLATPIAETSLTIEGVRVVVDSGLCRQMVFDPQSGLSHLETTRISMDMADQRTGRAGRVAPGVCYRLWSLATEHRMQPNRKPEIETADLAPMTLDITAWGERDPSRLTWLTQPPASHIAQAKNLLLMLDAIDADSRLTPHGRELSQMPCHPRIAQMMSAADTPSLRRLAADIAALLEEKDPLSRQPGGEDPGADICLRIEALRRSRLHKSSGGKAWERIAKIAEQYRHICREPEPDNGAFAPTDAGLLLAAAYPERIASARDGQHGLFMLSSGDLAQLPRHDDLAAEPWIVAANVNARDGAGRIFLAAPVDPQDLRPMVRERNVVAWDMKRGEVIARREFRIGSLILGAKPIKEGNKELITNAICQAAQKDGERMLNFDDEVASFQQRVKTVAEWHPEMGLPDVSTPAVLSAAPNWLPLFLGKATTVAEMKKIDILPAIKSLLTYDQQQEVDRLAPERIEVPTGSKIRVEYRQAAEAPVLRVRLQEVFGMETTPRVDDGKRPVLMELLSPGFKPVQLTSDLANFWANTYFEVRKELRRRYPKHSWPDNPLEAEAIRGAKRRKTD